MKIPIPNTESTKSDPFYRYQRDAVQYNKRGQFFFLDNIEIISVQMHADLQDLLTFMTKKMGQPIIINKKANTIAIKSLPQNIEDILEEYIKAKLVCTNCQLPELNKKGKCDACGKK